MIKSVNSYCVEDLIKKDANYYYFIPKYQRDYTWGPSHWKALYDDFMENDLGYFFGSIICINNTNDACLKQQLEVVDGQQRLTTVCLFLAALYTKLREHEAKIDEDDRDELTGLKKALLCSESSNGLILVPQIQGLNDKDFLAVMLESGIVKKGSKEKYWGNRKIAKCYNYFLGRIEQDILEAGENHIIETLFQIKKKIAKAVLVKIEVATHAEAYMLFESLNNRGAALTPIELMKNSILARAESFKLDSDDCYDTWQDLLGYLSDDYSTQERFFRHYYNAFKNTINEKFRNPESKKKDVLGSVATKSNLLTIYEALINKELPAFLEEVVRCGQIYSRFLLRDEDDKVFNAALTKLYRIQGAPSYLLLLYLLRKQDTLNIKDEEIIEIIELLTKFFVRRNLTDVPNTRDLTRIFMGIITAIEDEALRGDQIPQRIYSSLKEKSASDELFIEKLNGDIYEDNVGVTRFILCSLAEKYMTDEKFTDLWTQNDYNGKKIYKWTIEHVFPEGENIPKPWVAMIAGGDASLAKEYRARYVHKIGNLTMTVYNSELSNMPFDKKRDRTNSDGKFIGYKNGLEINAVLASKNEWTIADIENRTKTLVTDIIVLFAF